MKIKLIYKSHHTPDKIGNFKTVKGALNFIYKHLGKNIGITGKYIKNSSTAEWIYVDGDDEGIKLVNDNLPEYDAFSFNNIYDMKYL